MGRFHGPMATRLYFPHEFVATGVPMTNLASRTRPIEAMEHTPYWA